MMLPVIFGLSGTHVTADEQAFFRDANPVGSVIFEGPRLLECTPRAICEVEWEV